MRKARTVNMVVDSAIDVYGRGLHCPVGMRPGQMYHLAGGKPLCRQPMSLK